MLTGGRVCRKQAPRKGEQTQGQMFNGVWFPMEGCDGRESLRTVSHEIYGRDIKQEAPGTSCQGAYHLSVYLLQ